MRLGSAVSFARVASSVAAAKTQAARRRARRRPSPNLQPPNGSSNGGSNGGGSDGDGSSDGGAGGSSSGGVAQEDAGVSPQTLRTFRLVPQGVGVTVAAGVIWVGLGCNAASLGQAAADMGSAAVAFAAFVEGLYLLIHAVPLAALLAPSLALSRSYKTYCKMLTTPFFFASEVVLLSWLAIASPLGRVVPLLFILICHAALHLVFVGGVMVANKWFLRIQRERVQLGVKSPQIGVLSFPISQIIFLTAINSLNAVDAGLHAGYALSLTSLAL